MTAFIEHVNITVPKFIFIVGVLCVLWGYELASANNQRELLPAAVSNDPVIGRPFNISTGSIDEAWSSVAYNAVDHEYLVVWENLLSVTNDIYAQRISEQGELLSWFFVAQGKKPDVAYNPKNNTYLVVYHRYISTDYDVYAQRVDYTGQLGAEFAVAFNLNQNEASPAVAYNKHPNFDEFLVVWENIISQPVSISQIEGWRVAGTAGGGTGGGETIKSRISIATNGDYFYDPDLAYNLNMNKYLVVFTRQPAVGGLYDVYARRVTQNGTPLLVETPIDSSGGNQDNPAVAAYSLNHNTPYLIVFNDSWNDTYGDVRGYLVNQQGQPTQLVNIATVSGQSEFDPAIAQSETWGGYIVTWTQGPLNNHDIFGMRVSDIGLTYPEFDISDTSIKPIACDRITSDIAVGNVSALAIWVDPCGSAGGLDILGRMLGHRVYLPLTLR